MFYESFHNDDYIPNIVEYLIHITIDSSLDFVFIDGLHTYEQVTKDMNNYYDKVKPGGIFSGHDYRAIECINKAVNDFASLKNKQILETNCDVWYWIR